MPRSRSSESKYSLKVRIKMARTDRRREKYYRHMSLTLIWLSRATVLILTQSGCRGQLCWAGCHVATEMSDDSREDNVYMAKLAEQAERYDEVSSFVRQFSLLKKSLNISSSADGGCDEGGCKDGCRAYR